MANKFTDFNPGIINSGGRKNFIINGDFNIWQRGATFSGIAPNVPTWTSDHFQVTHSSSGVMALSQGGTPSVDKIGYKGNYSLAATVSTVDSAMAAGEYCMILTYIEGYDAAKLAGKTVTISFWVYASVTGIYCISLRNTGLTSSYIAEYTVNQATTWEKKTITVLMPDFSTGSWNSTNGAGVFICWAMSAGSTYNSGSNQVWNSGNLLSTTNQINMMATNNATLAISTVQLEIGAVATPFEYRPFIEELIRCQRYYEISGEGFGSYTIINSGVTSGSSYYARTKFLVVKRATPLISLINDAVSGFPATVGTITGHNPYGFQETRVCNSTVPSGYFSSGWLANAEV